MAFYASVDEMLGAIRDCVARHPGTVVISHDDERARIIWFRALREKAEPEDFQIRVTQAAVRPPQDPDVRKLFLTRKGREKLAMILSVVLPLPHDWEARAVQPTVWSRLLSEDLV